MAQIEVVTIIGAPVDDVFDLARSQAAHPQTTGRTREKIVEGPPHDKLELGDRVTFEARHFGIRQRLSAEVTAMEKPFSFTDRMIAGAFESLEHRHDFQPIGESTMMTDTLTFRAPLGPLGRLAETLFLKSYMRRFIASRGQGLKAMAEILSGSK